MRPVCARHFSRSRAKSFKIFAHALTAQIKGSTERVVECTTAVFDGCMAIVDPKKSWVVRACCSSLSLKRRRRNFSALVRAGCA